MLRMALYSIELVCCVGVGMLLCVDPNLAQFRLGTLLCVSAGSA